MKTDTPTDVQAEHDTLQADPFCLCGSKHPCHLHGAWANPVHVQPSLFEQRGAR